MISPLALEPPSIDAAGNATLPMTELPLTVGGQWRGSLHLGVGVEELIGITAAAALAEVRAGAARQPTEGVPAAEGGARAPLFGGF